jgi:hypothetical protein
MRRRRRRRRQRQQRWSWISDAPDFNITAEAFERWATTMDADGIKVPLHDETMTVADFHAANAPGINNPVVILHKATLEADMLGRMIITTLSNITMHMTIPTATEHANFVKAVDAERQREEAAFVKATQEAEKELQ